MGERLLPNGYSRPAITTHQREAFSRRCRGNRSEDSRQRRHAPAWILGLRLDYYSSTAQALRIIDGAATTRLPPEPWNDQIFVLLDLQHPLYCVNITPQGVSSSRNRFRTPSQQKKCELSGFEATPEGRNLECTLQSDCIARDREMRLFKRLLQCVVKFQSLSYPWFDSQFAVTVPSNTYYSQPGADRNGP